MKQNLVRAVTTLMGLFLCSEGYAAESVQLKQWIVVEECSADLTECTSASNPELKTLEISLAPAGKTKGGKLHGSAKFETLAEDTPFKGEVHINQQASGYSIYSLLRSGRGTSRHAVVKTIKTAKLSSFEPIELSDKPISISGKTYRAKMMVSPAAL